MFKWFQCWQDRIWLKWHGFCPDHKEKYQLLGRSGFGCLACYHKQCEIAKVRATKIQNDALIKLARLKGEQ